MATITDPVVRVHKREVIDKAVLRFCGDSGDGMQITGSQFTNTVRSTETTSLRSPITPLKFAPLPALSRASADSRFNFPRATFSHRAIRWTCWWP